MLSDAVANGSIPPPGTGAASEDSADEDDASVAFALSSAKTSSAIAVLAFATGGVVFSFGLAIELERGVHVDVDTERKVVEDVDLEESLLTAKERAMRREAMVEVEDRDQKSRTLPRIMT